MLLLSPCYLEIASYIFAVRKYSFAMTVRGCAAIYSGGYAAGVCGVAGDGGGVAQIRRCDSATT
jgi:hypothetical protein